MGESRMSASRESPTGRRFELAARLRQARIEANLSLDDAARELMCSTTKVSRLETGGRGIQPRDVRDLARLYGLSRADTEDLQSLVTASRKRGWWQNFSSLNERAATFIGLEDAASHIRNFDAVRLFGLVQTQPYTRALLGGLRPEGELANEWIDETVAARGKRSERVKNGDLTVHSIFDEAVLRRPIGGATSAGVMAAQIDHLLAVAEWHNVTLQVVPFAVGPYPGLDGSFQHMSFPGALDDIVFVEGLLGDQLVDREIDVAHYMTIFDDIAHRFALDPDATLAWLSNLRRAS